MKFPVYHSFNGYRNAVEKILQRIASAHHQGALDDQGVPAYISGFYWSRQIFWKRIKLSVQSILESPGGQCIDFGCGTGVLLPVLTRLFNTVYAIDISPDITREFISFWNHCEKKPPVNVHLFEKLENIGASQGSIDLIIALDSLEHVDNTEDILLQMKYFLKPGGRILISGPTENFFLSPWQKSGWFFRRLSPLFNL